MRQLPDMSAFEWIERGLEPPPINRPGPYALVAHCVPRGFEAYCKILHPIEAYSFNGELPVKLTAETTWGDIRKVDPTGMLATRVGELLNSRAKAPLRWRDLFRQLGLKWIPEVSSYSIMGSQGDTHWPVYAQHPSEGYLEPATLGRVVEILSPFTPGSGCLFYFSLLTTEDFEPRLFRGMLCEADRCFDGVQDGYTPTYWWPPDHTWCLCTDQDLNFTLFGGSADAVNALLADSILECVEVLPNTRVDIKADPVNLAGEGDR